MRILSIGGYGGICFAELDFDDKKQTDAIVVCYLVDGDEFPKHLERAFKAYFLRGNATCVECSHPMEELKVHDLPTFKYMKEFKVRVPPEFNRLANPSAFVVCRCGRPFWRMAKALDYIGAIARADRSQRRTHSLRNAGGKHSVDDTRKIARLQKGRCIYCNRKFTRGVPPTKDHLFAVVSGGSNWGLNIMMACRSCNSRRCDIPFRTYCKLLSPMQNRRILSHLCNRLHAVDFDRFSAEEFSSFSEGLGLHNPRHMRYRMIQGDSIAAQKNVAMNKLLPRTAMSLLRTWASQKR